MYEVRTTAQFDSWVASLGDINAQARVFARLSNMAKGNFGDWKSVGGRVLESRIHYGAGYRLYFMRDGSSVVLLLSGGDKSSQSRDILRAQVLAAAY
ncbi:Addiction module killer protein [Lysobacter dokdonensis DS-58]|uniref:Addiction module killer protein n=1 Tax=Lysobacter dokdonensis DS-58 TaxID=1300345 RepID=A0A0A2X1Z6_9GAMM|nr:type II toxin-antitoxin system RelE/ParE family toxin [Lysobacter dokdonensis]KGQ19214.1 Addiction module killer protein [Lysobacter dokdonensis DS-58]